MCDVATIEILCFSTALCTIIDTHIFVDTELNKLCTFEM